MKSILVGLAIGLLASPALAGIVVDTGTPAQSSGGWSLYRSGDNYQYLAAQFETGQDEIIDDVEGFVAGLGGTFHVEIATDINDQDTYMFSQQIQTVETLGEWQGVRDANWHLPAGIYWLVFSVRPGDTLYGWMPNPSPSPLFSEAFIGSGLAVWNGATGLDFGVRIYSQDSVVPEPRAWLLFIVGIGALGFSLRSRSRVGLRRQAAYPEV
ncbi:PEP-CTERM sorting domain-containing protein [Phenylobacterium sp.]|uniref:PEP-CTERM sorting domain-containing protein n=1 Tax=Phenylobacterium sp. TaxID=1871053 RepID=UPI003BA9794C